MLNIVDAPTFDDVLLIPKYSDIESRSSIDLSISLSKGIKLNHPLVPANMKTICGYEMAEAVYNTGGMALLHRFMYQKDQLYIATDVKKLPNGFNHIGFSIGVKKEDYEMVNIFAGIGVKILVIDIAHGHSKLCVDMTRYISTNYPEIFLIAGNVATAEGARMLWKAGADAVKVNIGAGSLCTTRLEAAAGVSQLTALSNVWDAKKSLEKEIGKPIFVMADGGCVSNGDFVKSLCFSDLVMTGRLFAGSEETPGENMTIDGITYKNYVGSSTHKTNHKEGVEALVRTTGKVKDILSKSFESIRSGLSYQGCHNLSELKIDPRFVKITAAGLKESGAHDVIVVK